MEKLNKFEFCGVFMTKTRFYDVARNNASPWQIDFYDMRTQKYKIITNLINFDDIYCVCVCVCVCGI